MIAVAEQFFSIQGEGYWDAAVIGAYQNMELFG